MSQYNLKTLISNGRVGCHVGARAARWSAQIESVLGELARVKMSGEGAGGQQGRMALWRRDWDALGQPSSVLLCVPPPHPLLKAEIESALMIALRDAHAHGLVDTLVVGRPPRRAVVGRRPFDPRVDVAPDRHVALLPVDAHRRGQTGRRVLKLRA